MIIIAMDRQDYIVWNPANIKTFSRSAITALRPVRKPVAMPEFESKPSVLVNMPFRTEF